MYSLAYGISVTKRRQQQAVDVQARCVSLCVSVHIAIYTVVLTLNQPNQVFNCEVQLQVLRVIVQHQPLPSDLRRALTCFA